MTIRVRRERRQEQSDDLQDICLSGTRMQEKKKRLKVSALVVFVKILVEHVLGRKCWSFGGLADSKFLGGAGRGGGHVKEIRISYIFLI